MSKNIFIAGVARSGKSTIATKVCKKLGYNHYPMDYVVASLKRNFPECNIVSNVVISDENSQRVALLFSTIINIIESSEEKFIVDSAHVLPKDIIKYLDKDKWDIYYVGYPESSKEEKFNIIKKYDKPSDWTYNKTDEELLGRLEKLIEISKEIKAECKDLEITFFDTSNNFNENINNYVNVICNKE